MAENNEVELDVGDAEAVDIEVTEEIREDDDSSEGSEDQFSKLKRQPRSALVV